MLGGAAYDDVTYGARIKVMGPLSSSASGYVRLSSVAASVAVVVYGTSGSSTLVNIFGIGAGWCCAHRNVTRFSSAFIRMASKVH